MPWPVTLPAAQRPAIAKQSLERYLDGERIADIAMSLSVTDKRLYQLLLEHVEDDWKNAQVATALARYEQAKEEMDRASTMLEVARAREAARIAQWDLERVCRRIYGQDAQTVLGQGLITINIGIGRRDTSAELEVAAPLPELSGPAGSST